MGPNLLTCRYCLYFSASPPQEFNLGHEVKCYCKPIMVKKDYPSCEKYTKKTIGDLRNPAYLAYIEREKDRKKEKRMNILLSGVLGLVGVALGFILGTLK